MFRLFLLPLGLLLLANLPSARANSALPAAVTSERAMVVTAHPLATEAGTKIVQFGGTAIDAMIAVQAVLGLVEPQSSGIGGGAFIVYYNAATGQLTTIDAREQAPAAAGKNRFFGEDGTPLDFVNAWQSGLAVGVPGIPKLMEYMHQRFGKLPWQRLFVPAIILAQSGFPLTERTSSQVASLLSRNPSCADKDRVFFRDPDAFDYFAVKQDCTAKPAGTLMRNQAYAETLGDLARFGASGFYQGPVAEEIAAAVQGDANLPGDMTVDDLLNYRVVEREPVCIDYRTYQVCGMGPPSSGGLAVGQMLGMMQKRPELIGAGPLDVKTVHLFTQVGRLAFADRNRYLADSDFITVPVKGLLDEAYFAERAVRITATDMGTALPGDPPSRFDSSAPDRTVKESGTSHISIIDRYGNALAMTTSIEGAFGNGVMVRGFLLNNQLTDFSFAYEDADGLPIANRVEPNKRPRSSMSPTIVLDAAGKVVLVTGSPGGSRIIGYTAQSIMNILDFGLDPQQAINLPHYMNRNGRTELEQPIPGTTLDYDVDALAKALADKGHDVGIVEQASGLSIIHVIKLNGKRRYLGGADARRDGSVGGR
ncbi:MAG: gamma-glutamyltransferase [Deltaproteobacteria bacterium]|nr:gamma-glutamyltransferase [Deltaproteobacteria bacterium]